MIHHETPDGQKLILGDVRERLRELPEQSLHVAVTSPPYYGLRDYGNPPAIWEPEPRHSHEADWRTCEHEWGEEGKPFHPGQVPDGKWPATTTSIPGQRRSSGGLKSTTIGGGAGQATNKGSLFVASTGRFCSKCGCWRGCFGQEPSVRLYCWHTVLICREIRRTLRDDATLWWNVGDSFAGHGGEPAQGQNSVFGGDHKHNNQRQRSADMSLGPKNLLLIPFRVAIALQDDGWIVRQVVIWSKVSPMPESVDDRPTTSHEYIFLLAKNPDYYFDDFAVRVDGEPKQTEHNNKYAHAYDRRVEALDGGVPEAQNNQGMHARPGIGGHNIRSVWHLSQEPQADALCRACGAYYSGAGWARLKKRLIDGTPQKVCRCGATDWVAHFAAYTSAIPRTAILAGTSEAGACPTCGKPWERVVVRYEAAATHPRHFSKHGQRDRQDSGHVYKETVVKMLGWRPACGCYHLPPEPPEPPAEVDLETGYQMCRAIETWCDEVWKHPRTPCRVLDPFVGSGTTVIVARELSRAGVGIDVSKDYLNLAVKRLEQIPLGLFGPDVAEETIPLGPPVQRSLFEIIAMETL